MDACLDRNAKALRFRNFLAMFQDYLLRKSWTEFVAWQDSRSMQPRIRKARLLITHVLDSCVKLLAVLHISSAQGRSVDRTSAGSS